MELTDVRTADLGLAQQLALARLQIFMMGETHKLLLEMNEPARKFFGRLNQNSPMETASASGAQAVLYRELDLFIDRYTDLIKRGIKQAVAIPFGTMAEYHERLILPLVEEEVEEVLEAQAAPAATLHAHYDEAVYAALMKRYKDDLAVSERIWLLNRRTRKQMNNTLLLAVRESWTVNQTGLALQAYMAPSPGCIGRVRQLLRGAVNRALLNLGGGPCASTALSYSAVRLARNEMTVALNIANDLMIQRMPYVTGEKINLSSEHGEVDQCDNVATGGRNGDGIYPVGSVLLPLHVMCMCYKEAVLMNPKSLRGRLSRFLDGGRWDKAQRYQNAIGGVLAVSLTGLAIAGALKIWLDGSPERLEERFWEEDAEMVPEELVAV
jgi:hypothetical protein